MKLTKKDIKKIEDLGWSVKETEDGYFLENYSPAGGDMIIEVPDKEGIIEYCDGYDPDEEFDAWWHAGRGEPSTPSDLWEDCLEKGKMFEALANVLR